MTMAGALSLTLVEFAERVADEAARRGIDLIADVWQRLGQRPVDGIEGTREEQLEQWLTQRDDPAAAEAMIAANAKFYGRQAAEHVVANEMSRLEHLLANAGDWSGEDDDWAPALTRGAEAVTIQRRAREALAAAKAAEAVDRLEATAPIRLAGRVGEGAA